MPLLKSRVPFSPQAPFRKVRPTTSKIIFLSCEGSVTEEEYFNLISDIYSEIKSKIQFISVAEDAIFTAPKCRTQDQVRLLSKVRPKHLVERIEQFKDEKDALYQFEKYPEDEFWILTDVDQNWSNQIIDHKNEKTYKDEWDDAISICKEKGYHYAVSNPFFEIWLLLHHDQPSDEDKRFAVSDNHSYEKTNHFLTRLSELGVPLKDKKHINYLNYNVKKIETAVCRAEELHVDKTDMCPRYFATTVYLLLKKIFELLPKEISAKD